MATLSIVAQGASVEVLAKTEPAAPPSTLVALLGVELPRSIRDGESLIETGTALTRCLQGDLSDDGRQGLVQAFTDLVVATNAHPNCGVVLLGTVELVAFASPADADPRVLEEFVRAMNLPGVEIKVVDEKVARAAAVLPSCPVDQRLLVCDWGDALGVRLLHVHDTLYHLSPVGEGRRSHRLGDRELARHVASAESEEERQAAHDQALGQLVRKGQNFLTSALTAVDTSAASCALVTGAFARHGLVHEAAERALTDAELQVVPRTASVSEGLHRCFRPAAKLPYDCGILLAPQGSVGVVGTLLLVRPTAVGQVRTSEQIEIPVQSGKTLEVGIYFRRLEFGEGSTTIRCEQFERLEFAPVLNEGVARLEVSMRVDDDGENPGEVLVSMVVRDKNSDSELRFDRVRLVGAEPLEGPLVRDPKVLSALDWMPHLEGALRSNPGKSFPVRAWHEYLTRPPDDGGDQKPGRTEYVESVFVAAGTRYGRLMDEEFVLNSSPEEIQRAARELLFECMHNFVDEHGTGGRWAGHYRKPTVDAALADTFLNEQAQALASRADRAELMHRVKLLSMFYRYACLPHDNLTVDWS